MTCPLHGNLFGTLSTLSLAKNGWWQNHSHASLEQLSVHLISVVLSCAMEWVDGSRGHKLSFDGYSYTRQLEDCLEASSPMNVNSCSRTKTKASPT